MFYGQLLHPTQHIKKKGIAEETTLNRSTNDFNKNGESNSNRTDSSANSKLKMANTIFLTFSSGFYNYHTKPSQQFNVTMENAVRSDSELSLEASFWVALIFMVFFCSVITVYCVMMQKEGRICTDQYEIRNINLENNPRYSFHSTSLPRTSPKMNDSTFTLDESSLEALSTTKSSVDFKQHTNKIKHGLSLHSLEITTLDLDNSTCGIGHHHQKMPKCTLNQSLVQTELKNKNHLKMINLKANRNAVLLAWKSSTKFTQNQTAYLSVQTCSVKLLDLPVNSKIENV